MLRPVRFAPSMRCVRGSTRRVSSTGRSFAPFRDGIASETPRSTRATWPKSSNARPNALDSIRAPSLGTAFARGSRRPRRASERTWQRSPASPVTRAMRRCAGTSERGPCSTAIRCVVSSYGRTFQNVSKRALASYAAFYAKRFAVKRCKCVARPLKARPCSCLSFATAVGRFSPRTGPIKSATAQSVACLLTEGISAAKRHQTEPQERRGSSRP